MRFRTFLMGLLSEWKGAAMESLVHGSLIKKMGTLINCLVSKVILVSSFGFLLIGCGGGSPDPSPMSVANGIGTNSSFGFSEIGELQTPRYTSNSGLSAVQGQTTGVWVSGVGSVLVDPDVAVVTVGVEARADKVNKARTEAARAMNGILAVLPDTGVQKSDIRTSYLDISPQYSWRERTDSHGNRYSQQILVGYIVTNQVVVTIRELDLVGRIVDDIAIAGGDLTRIQGIRFTVSDPTPIQATARELAVAEVLRKANQYADLALVTLGQMIYLSEFSSTPVVREEFARAEMSVASIDVSTPISAGQLEIRATIQAAFAIQ